MAWIDDRIWCHPKFTELSGPAGWTWTKGVAYSTGFGTRGRLEAGQQQLIGSTPKIRSELVEAGLWEPVEGGAIVMHDWDEHNSKRDDRRVKDRERKRGWRKQSTGQSTANGADVPQDVPQDDPAESRQERRALTEVTVVKEVKEVLASDLSAPTRPPAREGLDEKLWSKLAIAAGARTPDAIAKLSRTIIANHCSERDIVCAIEAATGPGVIDPLAVALTELKKRANERGAA